MSIIYHIATKEDWDLAQTQGAYTTASLQTEGFIHCSWQHQVLGAAERFFANIDNLYLLMIDKAQLNAALVEENTTGGEELFPHLYGTLNLEAVLEVQIFGRNSEGDFVFPKFQFLA